MWSRFGGDCAGKGLGDEEAVVYEDVQYATQYVSHGHGLHKGKCKQDGDRLTDTSKEDVSEKPYPQHRTCMPAFGIIALYRANPIKETYKFCNTNQ